MLILESMFFVRKIILDLRLCKRTQIIQNKMKNIQFLVVSNFIPIISLHVAHQKKRPMYQIGFSNSVSGPLLICIFVDIIKNQSDSSWRKKFKNRVLSFETIMILFHI